MQEKGKIGRINSLNMDQKGLPLQFWTGDVWDMGPDYTLERRGYDHYLLLYTMSGAGYLFYEEKEYQLLPGMAFLIDCSRFQVYRTAADRWEFAFIHFDTVCMREYVDTLCAHYGPVFSIPDGSQMENRMRAVIALFRGYNRMAGHEAFGLLAQLLGMLYAAGEQKDRDSRISESADSVLRIIEKQYPEKLTLDSIARAVGQSKYYLAHRFKTEMGMTIYGYLTLFRISKSKILLQNTNLPVSDIAEQVGFSGVSNFIRTFSSYEAMTPHQYRKQWQ